MKQYEITIEVCQNCHEHAWCTRHDEKKYNKTFDDIEKIISQEYRNIRLIKNKDIKIP